MPLTHFHPLISEWFQARFGEPTEAQRLGWPHIIGGEDTLIAAPTGSGKTLAAFLTCIDTLVREGLSGKLTQETQVLYISPLKALSNDIQRNLGQPLQEIQKLAEEKGLPLPPIRALVRTGDTPSSERQAMLRKPPQILVTTPESLYLLLTAGKSRERLKTVRTVIVDEIHAVARDKRGSHLALSLERLEALCEKRPVRIGLSATQRPMEEIARFLVGTMRVTPLQVPQCAVVDVGHSRPLDLGIEIPPSALSAVCSNEQWVEVYQRLGQMIREHRSTLVFVNTRRLAERVTHHLTDLLGDDAVSSHHGSLSKKLRLRAEQRLKGGELKAVVATASLELGIDIGFIDLVVQIGSPRSIATFLQRVGRSGHALGLIPKGRLFALTRDELLECAALIRGIGKGHLDRIVPPEAPLDILAQQIIAEAAGRAGPVKDDVPSQGRLEPPDRRDGIPEEDALNEAEAFDLCRRAWPYRNLSRKTFDDVLRMLSEGFATQRGRNAAYLHHDRVNRKIRARRASRLAALTSGGAIPELADYRVVAAPEKIVVGSVDEDFAVESLSGDVFLLGNTSWRVIHVRGGDVLVADAHGAPPSIPFWRGEAPARTLELSEELSDFRSELDGRIDRPDEAVAWLMNETRVDEFGARQILFYATAQKGGVGFLPTQKHLLFERFFDESGGMQLVIHSPYGGRINRAWGLALRKRFCRTFDFELQASADDNGIVISLGPQQSFPLDQVPKMVTSTNGKEILEQAVLAAPMFMTRWRWNANRALAVLRQSRGKKVPPALQRMRADDLLCAVFPQQMACRENLPGGEIPVPDHPLVQQTLIDCLHEAMDFDAWRRLLRSIEEGRIEITAADTREPSPFAYEILNASPYAFLDDAPLEERRARAVAGRRTLTVESVRDIGKLDPLAIEQVRSEAWPLVRSADELHDALTAMGALPASEGEAWANFFHPLVADGRAIEGTGADRSRFWIAAEQWPMVRAARPDLDPAPTPEVPDGVRREWSASEAWVALVRGRIDVIGPTTAAELAADLGLDPDQVEAALGALEAEGIVMRGRFTPEMNESDHPASPGRAGIQTDGVFSGGDPSPGDPLGQGAISPQNAGILGAPGSPAEMSAGAKIGASHKVEAHGPPHFIEWCSRRLLMRIHRLTLDRLRRQIEPAKVEEFFQFLLQWHRLLPGIRLHGREGLFTVVEQLQGFEIPAVAWERIILPSRIGRYDPKWLDELCLNGEVAWARLSSPFKKNGDEAARARPATRILPVSLMVRDDLPWLRWQHLNDIEPPLTENAKTVLDLLRRQGASFFSDLLGAGRLLPSQMEEAIWELVAAGLISGDGFAGVRSLVSPPQKQHGAMARRVRGRRSARAVKRGNGRWTLLPSISPEAVSPEEIAEAWAWQLLQRYGILFRDLLAREANAPPWHQLLPILRRLECRGEARGGRFVRDVGGEQYGLPEAVETLRRLRQAPQGPDLVFVSAVDPINLIGILTPGPRVTAHPSNAVAFHGGFFAGSRQGKEIWVSEKLNRETSHKIERTLLSGRLLSTETETDIEAEGMGGREKEQIGLWQEGGA